MTDTILTGPLAAPASRAPAVELPSVTTTAAPARNLPAAGTVLALQATVLLHADYSRASRAFASELAAAFGCSRVTVGHVQRGFARLAATSNAAEEKLAGPAHDPIVAAMDEAVEQGASVLLPRATETPAAGFAPIRLAHARLLQLQGGAVASVPVVYLGDVVGAVTCEWPQRPADLERLVEALENMLGLVGPLLHLMRLRDAPWRERAFASLRRGWQRLCAPASRRTPWIAAGALALMAGLLTLPLDYSIGGHARLEAEQQRAIVAPAEGYMKLAHVRPGDRVQRGQLLVEMADQDLNLQRRKWASELGQQESAYAVALAKADRASMAIALSKADEAKARLGLVEAELERGRIVAPFDGFVIQGDLSQSLGAPLERGKTLMLIAPAEKYRVVVEVDERDIAGVHPGQSGYLALSALPWDTLPLRVSRVTPIAKTVDGNNVFEVEAAFAADTPPVRPGLEGVARIDVGRRPFGWAGLHRIADWARLGLWAWWP